jgi:hypothetical protein
MEAFPNVDSVAVNYIWKWRRSEGERGIDDSRVDEKLIELLKDAGYLSAGEPAATRQT